MFRKEALTTAFLYLALHHSKEMTQKMQIGAIPLISLYLSFVPHLRRIHLQCVLRL